MSKHDETAESGETQAPSPSALGIYLGLRAIAEMLESPPAEVTAESPPKEPENEEEDDDAWDEDLDEDEDEDEDDE